MMIQKIPTVIMNIQKNKHAAVKPKKNHQHNNTMADENKYKCINKYRKTILKQMLYGIKEPIIDSLTQEEEDTLNQLIKDVFWLECANYFNKEDTIRRHLENFLKKKNIHDEKKITYRNEEKISNNKRYECIKKYAETILEQTSNNVIPPKIENITKEEQNTLDELISDVFWYRCCLLTPYNDMICDELCEIEENILDLFGYVRYDGSDDDSSDSESDD